MAKTASNEVLKVDIIPAEEKADTKLTKGRETIMKETLSRKGLDTSTLMTKVLKTDDLTKKTKREIADDLIAWLKERPKKKE